MEDELNEETYSDSPNSLITEKIKNELKVTKPWVRFLSVLGFIWIAFGFLGMAGMMIGMNSVPDGFSGPPMALIIGFNAILIVLYFFPALYLFKYASSIKKLLEEASVNNLEVALSYQKIFWRFIGYITIITFALMIVIVVTMPMFFKHLK